MAKYITCQEMATMFESDVNSVYFWAQQDYIEAQKFGGRFVIEEEYANKLLAKGENLFPGFRKSLWPRMLYKMEQNALQKGRKRHSDDDVDPVHDYQSLFPR